MPKSNLSVHIPFYRQTKRHGFGETTHHDWRVMDISRGSERVPVTSGKDIVSSGGVDIIQGRHSPRSESFKCHVIRDVGGDGLTRSVVGGRERNHVSPKWDVCLRVGTLRPTIPHLQQRHPSVTKPISSREQYSTPSYYLLVSSPHTTCLEAHKQSYKPKSRHQSILPTSHSPSQPIASTKPAMSDAYAREE